MRCIGVITLTTWPQ